MNAELKVGQRVRLTASWIADPVQMYGTVSAVSTDCVTVKWDIGHSNEYELTDSELTPLEQK